MAIAPIQLPGPITNTPINWSGLDQIGNALQMRGIMNRLGQMPDPTPSPGTPLPSVGQPQADATGGATPASIRTNNPGAQWMGPTAQQFGATGAVPLPGGNNAAVFPDAIHGAAAQFALLAKNYAGMPLGAAVAKWSGGNNAAQYTAAVSRATGISPDTPLTPEILSNPQTAVPLAKAMAQVEAGRPYPLSDQQWQEAHTLAFSGQPTKVASLTNVGIGAPPSQGQPQPAAAAAQPTQVAQATPQGPTGAAAIAQPWMTEAAAQRYEQAAAARYKQSMMASMLNPGLAASIRAQADAYMKQAEIIRQSLGKNSEITPEQKNSLDPNVAAFERTKAAIAAAGKNTELTPEQKNARGSGAASPLDYENQKDIQTKDVDAFNKEYIPIQKAGQTAVTGAQYAQMGKALTLQPGFYSGPFHEGVQTYQQFKSMFGSPSAATPMEALDKVANNMLIESVRSMGGSGVGRVLQSEVNAMKSTIANKGITPQTNRALLELAGRIYKVQQGMADYVQNIPREGGRSYQDLQAAELKYLREHPILNDAEKANPTLLGAPDAPKGLASPNDIMGWASGVGLRSGDAFRTPDGRIKYVP